MGVIQSVRKCIPSDPWNIGWKRKRRHSSSSIESDDESDPALNRTLHTRKRKRLMTTSQVSSSINIHCVEITFLFVIVHLPGFVSRGTKS